MLLDTLHLPEDLKSLNTNDLDQLAAEIRVRLLEIGQKCGGHLASNLGVVELTLALHAVFNSPTDKMLWDTSHQCYVHKMLTGRLDQMFTIRQYKGLSGFAKISESEHDTFGAGHASTALSAALGVATGRDLLHENYSVIAVLGDASLSCGMAFEALNNFKNLKGNLICILNDNDMAISPPVGHLAEYMTKLRTSEVYDLAKEKFERIVKKIPRIGDPLVHRIEKTVERLRDILLDAKFNVLFEEFGFKYLGPLDGHNIAQVMAALNYAKTYPGPIMIHIHTVKGKGDANAEADPVKYHGVSPEKKGTQAVERASYTQVFGESVCEVSRKFPKTVVITPAMQGGSGLNQYAKEFPERFFDVGIAEEHAVTFCAGLAKAGIKPILAIYSTFLQRGYDQVVHDICLQKLNVVFAIDRAGLVGEDGPTHHGVFDISYLLPIPNLVLVAPKDGNELTAMLNWAVVQDKSVAIRYPKGQVPIQDGTRATPIEIGKSEILYSSQKSEPDFLFIAVGTLAWELVELAEELEKEQKISSTVMNIRFLKPLDISGIEAQLKTNTQVVVIEDGCHIGGLLSYILSSISTQKPLAHFHHIAIPDRFIDHGKIAELREEIGLSPKKIKEKILDIQKTAALTKV